MLMAGHAGRHAWADPIGNLTMEWSDNPRERVVITWSAEDWDR